MFGAVYFETEGVCKNVLKSPTQAQVVFLGLTLKYVSASSMTSGCAESLGRLGTGPLTLHLMGSKATLATTSEPAEWNEE